MGRGADALDLISFLIALSAGTLLGILTGLGLGGGSLLMLFLTLAMHMAPDQARILCLLFFFPAALLTCILKRKEIPFRHLLPAMLWGSLSALVFSLLARRTDPRHFQKALGLLLLAVGLRELLISLRKNSRP